MKMLPFAPVACLALLLSPLAATAQDATLDKIKRTQTISVGARDASFPFSYIVGDSGNAPTGFTAELCDRVLRDIARDIGVENVRFQYTIVTPANRIPLLQNGTIDIECSTTTNTRARAEQVGFAPSHFSGAVTAAVRKDAGIRSLDDLNGKTVATVTGSTTIQLLRGKRRGGDFKIREISGKDVADTFLLLSSGRADAMMLEDVQLAGQIAMQTNPDAYTILSDSLREEPYGITYRKEDTAFGKMVDDKLTQIYASDDMQKLYDKWFMSPTPPRNINIQFPMPERLKQLYAHPSKEGV